MAKVAARQRRPATMPTEARALPTVLDEMLCTATAVGAVLVALLPAARGMSPIGWLPMWLVAMPALAWWGLHGFVLPRRRVETAVGVVPRTARRAQPQARRSARATRRIDTRRAA
jgi:hypothetical protein